MPEPAFQPLCGVRVLDLSRVLAGPVCSMVLADLGADVIKVERPGRGDDTREWGPPFIEEPAELAGMSAYFAAVNRNKRSITLDMTKPAGRDVLKKLVERSDVLLENFLPSSAAKLGLSPDDLGAINPRLIVCSISGFGRTGPQCEQPGYDFVVQALSGLMSITGEPAGEPMKVGVALTDVLTGLYAAVSVLAGLLGGARRAEGEGPEEGGGRRAEGGGPEEEIGRGLPELSTQYSVLNTQPASGSPPSALRPRPSSGSPPSALRPSPLLHFDLSLLDCTLASLVNVAQAFLVTGERPVRYGNAHPQIVPYECFATADGHVVLAVGNDEQWRRFCSAAGRDDLAANARFATNPTRVANRTDLVAAVRKLIATRTTGDWTDLLRAAEVPHAPVLALDQVFALPQVQARNMVVETPEGLKLVGSPIKCDGRELPDSAAPPTLGQHTDEILRELGYTGDEITRLRAQGVL